MDNAAENKKKRIIKTEEERIRELTEQIKRIKKSKEQKTRKLETRQKILVGSAMLGLLNNMDEQKRLSWVNHLKTKLSEKDKCIAFPDIQPPQAAVMGTSETVRHETTEAK